MAPSACFFRKHNFSYTYDDMHWPGRIAKVTFPGPVTDYGSSVAKWMQIRQAGWRGQPADEVRPAPPYIIDASCSHSGCKIRGTDRRCSYFHQKPIRRIQQCRYVQSTPMHPSTRSSIRSTL